MERRSRQTANAHDQPGVLDLAALIQKFRSLSAALRILQRLDQILDPIGLVRFDVVIEKNEPLPSGGLRAEIALVRKVERLS